MPLAKRLSSLLRKLFTTTSSPSSLLNSLPFNNFSDISVGNPYYSSAEKELG